MNKDNFKINLGVKMISKRRKGRFDFKQFSIIQENSAMKVGTDGVLLGAWTNIDPAQRALDIGTGTGLVALMLAQRHPALEIDGIEIDAPSFSEAKVNAACSPWSDRVNIIKGKVQDLPDSRHLAYDLIVSNPPYFSAGTLPPAEGRHQARHNSRLTPAQLLKAVRDLLKRDGRFSVILPTLEGASFTDLAKNCGFFLSRKTAFYAKKNKPQERWLIEFTRKPTAQVGLTELVQYDENGDWSTSYKNLTQGFYLKL